MYAWESWFQELNGKNVKINQGRSAMKTFNVLPGFNKF